jgi:signal peptidase II
VTPTARRNTVFIAVALAFLAGDRVTKRLAEAALTPHFPHRLWGRWVQLTLTWNRGSAMGLFSFGGASRWIFAAVAVAMVGVLLALLREAPPEARWRAAALGAVTGGALGNLVDRLLSGRGVTDFIDVGTAQWRFWTFNVADVGVTCGAILLAILLTAEERRKKRSGDPGM